MADKLIVDCSTGATSTSPVTTQEQAARDAQASADTTERTTTSQREQRRQQAIDRLNAFVALGAGATAAQVRTESQFAAKVLAKVLPFIDIDPT
jgi:hypothetical protein